MTAYQKATQGMSKREKRIYTKFHFKIRKVMTSQEPNCTRAIFIACSETAHRICSILWDEYKSRRDRGLWVERLISSGKIWNIA